MKNYLSILASISQARTSDGEWIEVPRVKDALFVNLGALMQKWTGKKYLACVSLIAKI